MITNKEVVIGLTSDKGVTKTRNGPALRYVGPLPTSGEDSDKNQVGNYNFEEEYLLGDNKITVRWYDNVNHCYRERIEFKQEEQQNDYYQIDYFETDIQPDDYDFTYDHANRKLTINLHNKMDNFNDTISIDSRADLWYKDKNGEDTFISSKIIKKRINNNNGEIKETISQE